MKGSDSPDSPVPDRQMESDTVVHPSQDLPISPSVRPSVHDDDDDDDIDDDEDDDDFFTRSSSAGHLAVLPIVTHFW